MTTADETDLRLQDIAGLPQNWDSYGARPPNTAAISGMRLLLQALGPFMTHAPGISPTTEGSVTAEWLDAHGNTLILDAESETRFGYYSANMPAGRECEGVFEIEPAS